MVGGARGAAGSRLGTYIFSIAMAEEDCKARILVLDVQDRDCRPLHASVRVHRLSQSRSHGRGGNDLKGDRTAFAAPRARMPRIAPCRLPHQRGNITFAPTRASVHARMNLRGGRPTCFVVTKAVTSAPGVSTAVVSQSRTPGTNPTTAPWARAAQSETGSGEQRTGGQAARTLLAVLWRVGGEEGELRDEVVPHAWRSDAAGRCILNSSPDSEMTRMSRGRAAPCSRAFC